MGVGEGGTVYGFRVVEVVIKGEKGKKGGIEQHRDNSGDV